MSRPDLHRHATIVFAGCKAFPEVCKLNPAHHLV